MKKQLITGITIIVCVALCAAVWPRSGEDGKSTRQPIKTAVIAEIEAKSEETPSTILLSVDTHAPEPEVITENKPAKTEVITAEEKTQKPEPTQEARSPKPSTTSAEPRMGDTRVVNGEKQIYILGFG
ncbi:MAG: hypothetical protein U1D96_01245 [Eubacteriales bacterium]|nr:hypothetical protein [Eubacteriales bacterium]MDZ4042109.1 hypothetical protein [Eubacteriales bacterium]